MTQDERVDAELMHWFTDHVDRLANEEVIVTLSPLPARTHAPPCARPPFARAPQRPQTQLPEHSRLLVTMDLWSTTGQKPNLVCIFHLI
jgi:hypothetical protein